MKKSLDIKVFDDHEAMSRAAADFIISELKKKPDSLVSIATGQTPGRTYELLAEEYRKDPSLFSGVIIAKLDEWGGVPLDDPATCETEIREKIIGPLGVSEERFITFANDAEGADGNMADFQRRIDKAGGLDICILGLGLDGHLGLNEPGEYLELESHIVRELNQKTLQHSMVKKSSGKISFGLTLGMRGIFEAKKVLFLVNGGRKREIFSKFKEGLISSRNPASLLWLHPDASCFCDKDAYGAID